MKNVYLVHDQEESPAARRNVLEMAGFQVSLFKSGRELFLALKEGDPDVVVMDVLIEGRNGFETLRELDSRMDSRRFPVLVCARIYTGHVFREEAFRSGAQDFLTFPMNLKDFVESVNSAITGWREHHKAA